MVSKPRTETCSDRRRRSTTCQNSELKHAVIDAAAVQILNSQLSIVNYQLSIIFTPYYKINHVQRIFPRPKGT